MPHNFQDSLIAEFRANHGRLSGRFEGARMLLLTTTGARSGQPHTTPVAYLPDGGERVLVIASAMGSPKHPDWFHNLVANPRVTVENGVFTYQAEATVLEGTERDTLFARAAEADPGWAEYQRKTTRTIPVVALRQIPGGPPDVGTVSFGEALQRIHDAFRRELTLIRAELATSGTGLGAQLRVNCLTLCAGLHFHHTAEDAGFFPMVAGRGPELAPVIDRLRSEHEQIAVLLERLQEIVGTDSADASLVLPEVDRLIDQLERHLTYEEEQLIPVLDA